MNSDTAVKPAPADDSGLNQSLPQVAPAPSVSRGAKESEPSGAAMAVEEAKLMKEILQASEIQRGKDLEPVLKAVSEAKLAHPKVAIPPDVEDAGVVEPEEEAAKAVVNGPTIRLPISEQQYQAGLKTGASGKWYKTEREVVGVKSIVALALWVGKMVKVAHGHAARVLFRKGAR